MKNVLKRILFLSFILCFRYKYNSISHVIHVQLHLSSTATVLKYFYTLILNSEGDYKIPFSSSDILLLFVSVQCKSGSWTL